MKTKLIQIGNSFGVRLPRSIISECGFEKELDLFSDDYKKKIEDYADKGLFLYFMTIRIMPLKYLYHLPIYR